MKDLDRRRPRPPASEMQSEYCHWVVPLSCEDLPGKSEETPSPCQLLCPTGSSLRSALADVSQQSVNGTVSVLTNLAAYSER